jgi:hypothetical protein
MSTEGENRLNGGSISSIEGETRLQRGGDLSTEGKTHLRIGRLVYGGGDLSKEG